MKENIHITNIKNCDILQLHVFVQMLKKLKENISFLPKYWSTFFSSAARKF